MLSCCSTESVGEQTDITNVGLSSESATETDVTITTITEKETAISEKLREDKRYTEVSEEDDGNFRVSTEGLSLTYTFASTARGMAGGELYVKNLGNKRSTLTVWWGNENGLLEEYSLLVESMIGSGLDKTFSIHPMTVIPQRADRCYVITETEVVSLLLSRDRLLNDDMLYSFG